MVRTVAAQGVSSAEWAGPHLAAWVRSTKRCAATMALARLQARRQTARWSSAWAVSRPAGSSRTGRSVAR